MMRNPLRYIGVIVCLTIIGCAAKVPPEIMARVTFEGDFAQLQADPQNFVGRYVIFGGRIIDTTTKQDHSEIMVLQFPLKDDYQPDPKMASKGRFLIKSETLLDPEIYRPGLLVTAAGEIAGGETRPIGSYDYVYPVIASDRLWTWDIKKDITPRLHFGVGIGTVF